MRVNIADDHEAIRKGLSTILSAEFTELVFDEARGREFDLTPEEVIEWCAA